MCVTLTTDIQLTSGSVFITGIVAGSWSSPCHTSDPFNIYTNQIITIMRRQSTSHSRNPVRFSVYPCGSVKPSQ